MNYKERKIKNLQKRSKLKFLKKLKVDLNLKMQLLNLDMKKSEEEKENEYAELLGKLREAEIKDTELRRNKFNSSAFKHIPHIGLNRKQRRNLK